ncbi:hypothetical protein KSP40_PGU020386 [Platanthera guangdongensis]|uniref:Uncharacterized protein n=1 Tax=Platanthera guangdongensis TaxID=2320717 RepID=A0ABR2MZC5_9ASPA
MTHELEAVLEAVDPKLMRRGKLDLLSGFSSTAIASRVANIVGMLNQEDANDSDILPVF